MGNAVVLNPNYVYGAKGTELSILGTQPQLSSLSQRAEAYVNVEVSVSVQEDRRLDDGIEEGKDWRSRTRRERKLGIA